MIRHPILRLAIAAAMACGAAAGASAATQSTSFDHLIASTTIGTSLATGDNLLVDTLVTGETGALTQSVTFTLGADVGSFDGHAVWDITTADGTGPRLVGVDINILDSSNAVVASDTFAGVLAGFAHSTFTGLIGPGTYTLVATGDALRDTVLDISLSFAGPIPEPGTYAMLLAGLAAIGFTASRRSQ